MQNKRFSEFAKHLYGRKGRYWPEFGTQEAVWRYSFLDQYPDGEQASEESVQRYCTGISRYPSRLRKRYTQDDGLAVLIQNMERVVNSSSSLKRVRSIQQEVHMWLTTAGFPPKDLERINQCYVAADASRNEIALYLATVMHKIIIAS